MTTADHGHMNHGPLKHTSTGHGPAAHPPTNRSPADRWPADRRPGDHGVSDHSLGDRRAESALDRARGRARRAFLLRTVLIIAAVLLWTAAGALSFSGAGPGRVALCGVPAVLLTGGLWAARTLGRGFVAVTVYGRSMEPAHRDGDRVLVRRGAVPVPGSVVVVERPPFRSPWPDPPVAPGAAAHVIYERQWVIKRVAAVPGDAVPRGAVPPEAAADAVVPEGMLVLLGDNAAESYDSRHVGYFPSARILGSVVSRR
ncbi:S26 family signal peptidase [Streptomyces sp. NPDC000229]|uniref:S26 family signal peptidase n=1 Tax=Streptomyces sp. NPDC000229 TaxID=3154247 RepID=UPI00331F6EEC